MSNLFKQKTIKGCNDCTFMADDYCTHSVQQGGNFNVMTGKIIETRTTCDLMRDEVGRCGKNAKYFKLKEI